jgi:DNA polymerase III subunit epsilon
MAWLIIGAIAVLIVLLLKQVGVLTSPSFDTGQPRKTVNLAALPQRFVVLDLETTGLDPLRNEIIEIGAIRVNRDSDIHGTFRTLVKPVRHILKNITQINGISQDMVDREGIPLEQAIREFTAFIEDLPLVTFNAEFDMAFLRNAAKQHNVVIGNPASCALKMARLAWPGRKSYRLSDLAKDGGLSDEGTHHAPDDCRRTLIVYVAAVSILGVTAAPIAGRGPEMRVETLSARMRAYRQCSRIPTAPAERNLLGIEFEAEGLVDNAIECYQANVRDGFEGNHPYDRLAVIFRRRRDAASEIAVLTRAIEVFSQLQTSSRSDMAQKLEKFRQRLRRVPARSA